jgi:hypothetical protein
MAKGTVTERSFDLMPEGWYGAKLIKIEDRDAGGFAKLAWRWEILEGEQAKRWIFGDCFARLDQSDGCTWRRWHEALIDRRVDVGEDIDTDDVIGFLAQVYVQHRSYEDKKNNNEIKWVAGCPDDPSAVQPMSVDESDLPVYPPTADSPIYQEGYVATPRPTAANDDPWATSAQQSEGPPF